MNLENREVSEASLVEIEKEIRAKQRLISGLGMPKGVRGYWADLVDTFRTNDGVVILWKGGGGLKMDDDWVAMTKEDGVYAGRQIRLGEQGRIVTGLAEGKPRIREERGLEMPEGRNGVSLGELQGLVEERVGELEDVRVQAWIEGEEGDERVVWAANGLRELTAGEQERYERLQQLAEEVIRVATPEWELVWEGLAGELNGLTIEKHRMEANLRRAERIAEVKRKRAEDAGLFT